MELSQQTIIHLLETTSSLQDFVDNLWRVTNPGLQYRFNSQNLTLGTHPFTLVYEPDLPNTLCIISSTLLDKKPFGSTRVLLSLAELNELQQVFLNQEYNQHYRLEFIDDIIEPATDEEPSINNSRLLVHNATARVSLLDHQAMFCCLFMTPFIRSFKTLPDDAFALHVVLVGLSTATIYSMMDLGLVMLTEQRARLKSYELRQSFEHGATIAIAALSYVMFDGILSRKADDFTSCIEWSLLSGALYACVCELIKVFRTSFFITHAQLTERLTSSLFVNLLARTLAAGLARSILWDKLFTVFNNEHPQYDQLIRYNTQQTPVPATLCSLITPILFYMISLLINLLFTHEMRTAVVNDWPKRLRYRFQQFFGLGDHSRDIRTIRGRSNQAIPRYQDPSKQPLLDPSIRNPAHGTDL